MIIKLKKQIVLKAGQTYGITILDYNSDTVKIREIKGYEGNLPIYGKTIYDDIEG